MAWKVHSNPARIKSGTAVRATSGDNVLYGVWETHGSEHWGMIKFPVQPSEPLVLLLKSWEISVEFKSFGDVFSDADEGTVAVKKVDHVHDPAATYILTQAGVVNSRTLNRVQEGSNVWNEDANNFIWSEPKAWKPVNN